MIPKHAQFITAIHDKKLVRISFYSKPDAGTVDRECAPLDYGPQPGLQDSENRYWVWDPIMTAGANPIGLLPAQIITLDVLGTGFKPEKLPAGPGPWSTPRNWS